MSFDSNSNWNAKASFQIQFQTQEDSAWQATFDKTVAAYERNRSQHPTLLLADFYVFDESAKVYNASTGFVLENNRDDPSNSHDKDYFTNASRCAKLLNSNACLTSSACHVLSSLVKKNYKRHVFPG